MVFILARTGRDTVCCRKHSPICPPGSGMNAAIRARPSHRPPEFLGSGGCFPKARDRLLTQSSTASSYQPTAIGPSLTRAGKSPRCSSRQVCEGLKPVRFSTSGFRMIFRCLRAVRAKCPSMPCVAVQWGDTRAGKVARISPVR
jgi:hypothetical protein